MMMRTDIARDDGLVPSIDNLISLQAYRSILSHLGDDIIDDDDVNTFGYGKRALGLHDCRIGNNSSSHSVLLNYASTYPSR